MTSLPLPLAYVWQDVEEAERDGSPALAVYHLLDAVEVGAKFLVAVSVAELDAANGSGGASGRDWWLG